MGKFITIFFLLFQIVIFSSNENIRLLHPKVTKADMGKDLLIEANIINAHLVNYILLHYKGVEQKQWSQVEMNPVGGKFVGIIPSSEIKKDGVMYYIEIISVTEQSILAFASENSPQFVEAVQNEQAVIDNVEEKQNIKNEKEGDEFEEFQIYIDALEQRVVTASKKAEPIKEAPVPITVITEEMIKLSGFKNLKDVLITFIPGMTYSQDHNEYNISMRGVYASSQQKVLLLRDGHRLNCRAYSEANPDYSISLENIKQIEVLRGPGSSIYGNVALTAVVNIITKSGKEVDGMNTYIGYGNYNQMEAGFVYGKKIGTKDDNYLLWGQIYQADGQKYHISENEATRYFGDPSLTGVAILDGFKDKPSYDLGMKYRFGEFTAEISMRGSKYIEPFMGSGRGVTYDYDKYPTLDGNGPGLGSEFLHGEFQYEKEFVKGLTFQIQGYFDLNSIFVVLTNEPSATQQTNGITEASSGIKWNEYSFGTIVQLNKDYQIAGEGSLLFGIQIDSMSVYDSLFLTSENGYFNNVFAAGQTPVLENGKESVYSSFLQLKHRFTDQIILNVGGRFDYKNRHKGDSLTDISPRVALIYIPSDIFDIKLSFARSFVDAPYWYRYNNLASYKGSEGLKPEYLSSIQLTPSISLLNHKLKYTLNVFYNDLTDFIYRDPNATGDEPRYLNAGELKSIGVEQELAYIHSLFQIRANATYQHVLDYKNYVVTDNKINNVPSFNANLIFDVNLGLKGLWFHTDLKYIGSQKSPIATINPDYEIDAVFLANIGVRYEFNKFFVDGRVWNLLGSKYESGGAVTHPYPQAGRWFFLKTGYTF
ncbi:TonB-dependent receptor [bacterium]|nr:TonB-dependent receptor [bacterium]